MRFEVRGAQEQGISVEALGEILKERGHEVTGRQEEAHICLWFEHREEPGYQIRKEGKEARIFWNRLPEAFRALGKVLEHGEEEAWSEENQGVKGHTGFMFDCSRNSVLKVEMVKRLIRQTALMGLEWFLLYTEDTYEVKGYPYFGALRGRYTEEEIRECDAYAALFGVEMIPCIQTLAHLRTALRWPAMEQYRDNMDILLAEEEKTYELIDAMLAAVSRMYRSRRVHLGMDEAFYLGYGNYRRIHGEVKQGELIRRHLARVMKICEKYGLDPMIWSDMFFVTPGGGDYYNVPADYEWPEGEKPDRRTTLVYWDYEGHDRERYARMARLHRKLTDQVCFAGAAWIWNGLAPNYAKALDASRAAFEGIREAGVSDTFLTLWLDNGAETPMETGLPMLAAYSAYMYGKVPDKEKMEQVMKGLFGVSWDDFCLLDAFDHIPGTGEHNEKFANPSKTIFYQDPLVGIFDRQFEDLELEGYYRDLAGRLENAEERNGKMRGLFHYYRLLAAADAAKSTLGTRIRSSYLKEDKETLKKIASEELPELITKTFMGKTP